MKTTIDLPEDLLRRAKAEAALSGSKLKDLVEEGLRLRLSMKKEPPHTAGKHYPLVKNLNSLPLIKGRPGDPKLNVTPQRVHELEMEAEMQRHEASLR